MATIRIRNWIVAFFVPTVVAIALGVSLFGYVPSQVYNREMGITLAADKQPTQFPTVQGITFHDADDSRPRFIALHRMTQPDGRRDSSYPSWLRFSMNQGVVYCSMDGQTMIRSDEVQIAYATDNQQPQFVRIPYIDFRDKTRAFPHEVWDLLESHHY